MDRLRFVSLAGAAALAGCAPDIPDVRPHVDADPSPVLFLSGDEAARIRAHTSDAGSIWSNADKALATAVAGIGGGVPSVVDDGKPVNGTVHQFGTDDTDCAGNCCSSGCRGDYTAALHAASDMVNLAVDYAVNANETSGARCVDDLVAWFVDPATSMFPDAHNYGPETAGKSAGTSFLVYLSIPPMFYAASLVWHHDAWTMKHAGQREQLATWARAFLDTVKVDEPDREEWRIFGQAATAAFLRDDPELDVALAAWRGRIDALDTSQGFDLLTFEALGLTAEIARHHGRPAYDYGKMKAAVSAYQSEVMSPENEAMFELYSSAYPELGLDSLLVNRPYDETYVLHPVTLTHGDRGALGAGP